MQNDKDYEGFGLQLIEQNLRKQWQKPRRTHVKFPTKASIREMVVPGLLL